MAKGAWKHEFSSWHSVTAQHLYKPKHWNMNWDFGSRLNQHNNVEAHWSTHSKVSKSTGHLPSVAQNPTHQSTPSKPLRTITSRNYTTTDSDSLKIKFAHIACFSRKPVCLDIGKCSNTLTSLCRKKHGFWRPKTYGILLKIQMGSVWPKKHSIQWYFIVYQPGVVWVPNQINQQKTLAGGAGYCFSASCPPSACSAAKAGQWEQA